VSYGRTTVNDGASTLGAIEGDPLQRIDELFTGVRWVMKDGRVVVDRRGR